MHLPTTTESRSDPRRTLSRGIEILANRKYADRKDSKTQLIVIAAEKQDQSRRITENYPTNWPSQVEFRRADQVLGVRDKVLLGFRRRLRRPKQHACE